MTFNVHLRYLVTSCVSQTDIQRISNHDRKPQCELNRSRWNGVQLQRLLSTSIALIPTFKQISNFFHSSVPTDYYLPFSTR